MKNNFAYFILGYGKSDDILTINALNNRNAKYPIYIVVGKDDPKLEEYRQKNYNLLEFDKSDYYDCVDSLGVYNKTHKLCTYARPAVDDFVKQLDIRYGAILFDDIISFNLRYEKNGGISSLDKFDIDDIIDMYIDLLNSSSDIYLVGPPNSAFYIGVNTDCVDKYSERFGNMYVFDSTKSFEPYKASVIEDMTIIMNNNMRGKVSICPFGLHVNCREPGITEDSYMGMDLNEYIQQKSIMCGGTEIKKDIKSTHINYSNFIPKIIDEKYRYTKTVNVKEQDLWG